MCAVDTGIDKINRCAIVVDQILPFRPADNTRFVPDAIGLVITRRLRPVELGTRNQWLHIGAQARRDFFNRHVDCCGLIEAQQNRPQHDSGGE